MPLLGTRYPIEIIPNILIYLDLSNSARLRLTQPVMQDLDLLLVVGTDQVASEVYVWDDRAQHGMNAAFAFSSLLILILLAGRQFVSCFYEASPSVTQRHLNFWIHICAVFMEIRCSDEII